MANGRRHKKIGVFRALQLGDMLCAVPALRALRGGEPDAEIILIGLQWAEDFVERFGKYVDRFIQFPGWPGLPEQTYFPERVTEFLEAMQKERLDLAIQMQGNGNITNSLVNLFGARHTAGHYQLGNFCPNPSYYLPYPERIREADKFLRLMEYLGMPNLGDELELPTTEEEKLEFQAFAKKYKLKLGEYVCLHPGARAEDRRWGAEKFARLAEYILKLGWQVAITGTREEKELTSEIEELTGRKIINLAGKTSLGLLANLIANSRLLVSNDTGVSHVADAVKAPSVVIFGSSDPKVWAPKDRKLHRVVLWEQARSMSRVIGETKLQLQARL